MKVTCGIEEIELDGDAKDADGYHRTVPSTQATCSRCDHTTESYGTSEASVRRCLVLMREECPGAESNYYVEE